MKIVILKKDLKRETFRSGGKGGQNQNKVETGVRYTHIPSRLVGESRDERSQAQNDEIALERLLAKIRKFYEERQRQEIANRYQNKPDATLGNHIRTYKLCGHKKVIDYRTKKEYNPDEVLNGNIPLNGC